MRRNMYIQINTLLDVRGLDNRAKSIGNLVQGRLCQLLGFDARDRSVANCVLDTNDIVAQLRTLSRRRRHANMGLHRRISAYPSKEKDGDYTPYTQSKQSCRHPNAHAGPCLRTS